MKKIIYFLGGATAAVAPVVAVVSCGSKSTTNTNAATSTKTADEDLSYLYTPTEKETRTIGEIFLSHPVIGKDGQASYVSPLSKAIADLAALGVVPQMDLNIMKTDGTSVNIVDQKDFSTADGGLVKYADSNNAAGNLSGAKVLVAFDSQSTSGFLEIDQRQFFVVNVDYAAYAFDVTGIAQNDHTKITDAIATYIKEKIAKENEASIVVVNNQASTSTVVDTTARDKAAEKFWYPFPYGIQTDWGSFAAEAAALEKSDASRVIKIDLGASLDDAARVAQKASFFAATPAFLAPVAVVVSQTDSTDKLGNPIKIDTKEAQQFYVEFTVAGKTVIVKIGQSEEYIKGLGEHGYDWKQEYSDAIIDYVFEAAKVQ